MKRVFICHILPQELIREVNASQAANNFCLNLINCDCFDKTYSLIPISYKIHNKINNTKNINYYTLNYINKLLSIINYIFTSIKISYLTKDSKSIWFYNIVPSSILLYCIVKFILHKKTYIILADHTPEVSLLNWRFYAEKLINSCNGIINLSYRSLIKHTNSINIAGIVPTKKIKTNLQKDNINKNKFLFSGTLSKVTGIDLALEVFSLLPECHLYISGIGDIPQHYKNCPNIHFLGMIDYKDYIKLLDNIDICLSFRNPNLKENLNNFPSKILEYFANNKIVISTITYPELNSFEYFKSDYSIESIITTIKDIQTSNINFNNWIEKNNKNLRNEFSENIWIKSINELESKL